MMKGVEVYHTIQVLRNSGKSYREIAIILKISKTTVQRYLNIPIEDVEEQLSTVKRSSKLDPFRDDFVHRLEQYPDIRSSRLYRDFCKQHPEVQISSRGFRKYIQKLKKKITRRKIRYFEPVTYHPGQQIQVDLGEKWVNSQFGNSFKVYFAAFSLSFSRMKYVYFQNRPFKTKDFIRAHESCFSYFGHIPLEMVYDQTKLVVIQEKYREIWFNETFWQFSNKVGFSPYICEGYDPESKGLIERAIREVKEDFLYGQEFFDLEDLRQRSLEWLPSINSRIHHTTKKRPLDLFAEEKDLMKPYEVDQKEKRRVDKTGLISWKGNKYSVPYQYQRKDVFVFSEDTTLHILAYDQKNPIAIHKISSAKGKRFINNNHYRDYEQLLSELKNEVEELFADIPGGRLFIERLVADNPKHPRDQLRAVKKLYMKNSNAEWKQVFEDLLPFPKLRASLLESMLVNSTFYKSVEKYDVTVPSSSSIQRSLAYYEKVIDHD